MSSDLDGKTIHLELSRQQQQQQHEPDRQFANVENVQKFIEEQTGFITVIKGLGTLSSAVAELRPAPAYSSESPVYGVVRLSQLEDSNCFVEGSIGGLCVNRTSTHYSLAVHEFGNLDGDIYEELGERLLVLKEEQKVRLDGKLSIWKVIPDCKVHDLIGRSIAISEIDRNVSTPTRKVLSAGVVARASTVEVNKKQICSCSGKTLWDERLERKQKELH